MITRRGETSGGKEKKRLSHEADMMVEGVRITIDILPNGGKQIVIPPPQDFDFLKLFDIIEAVFDLPFHEYDKLRVDIREGEIVVAERVGGTGT